MCIEDNCPPTVIPAKAGIQKVRLATKCWF